MAELVSDFLLDRLSQWGVERIFGFPGDGINGLMGAMDRAGDKLDFVRTSHEEMAAFMASAHAKFTGKTGVCMATSGPGAIHLLNGLYDAKMDHQPVVAIVGQQSRKAIGGSYQQEVDLISLFKDVSAYVEMATDPAQIRHLVDRGMRIAQSQRSVSTIIVPTDLQEMEAVEEPPRAHGTVHSSVGYEAPRIIPPEDALRRAADVLNGGERVAMLVGAGALHATDEVLEIANKLQAGIAKALLGMAVVPDDLPYVTGAIGLLGTKPSWTMMNECDTLLMVGSSFPYSEFLPKEGQANAVQIDIDGRMIGLRYPMNVHLLGDSRDTLRELIPLIHQKHDTSWRDKLEQEREDWWDIVEERAMEPAEPMNPQRVFWELDKRLPADAILSADSGSSANWFARDIHFKRTMKASLSGNLATMCPGVPYTIAAKFAHPDKVCIGFVGDGAMQMLGNNGLVTISRYWERWSDPRLIILVLNNGDLNQVTWEMRVQSGNPKYEASQYVPDFHFAEFAEMLGLKGIRVDDPEKLGAVWDEALSADRPVVVEAMVDPNVPPLPPHITLDQAKKYTSTLLKGDPDEGGIIRQTVRDAFATVLPGRSEPKKE